MQALLDLNPFTPEVMEDPYAVYAELRRRGVYQLPGTDMFIVTRFRDVESVLMRPEVLTHQTNTDQRLLELVFSVRAGDRLEVQGPPGPGHMPQGYALLFVLSEEGIPSVGRFTRVG